MQELSRHMGLPRALPPLNPRSRKSMMRDIERRLHKLESQVPPPKPAEEQKIVQGLQRFLMNAVAYYLGDPTPKESIAQAYMRALGYSHWYEFRKALDANDPDFFERE